MTSESEQALITRYEELRRLLDDLDRRAKELDSQLMQLETSLPDWYRFDSDQS